MNHKEKLTDIIRGNGVDRESWSPFLAYYYEHLPEEVQKMGQLEYMNKIGATPMLRGIVRPVNITYNNCEVQEEASDKEKVTRYITKHGTLTERHVYNGDTWFLVDHPINNKEELIILKYIMENIQVEVNEDCAKVIGGVGDKALVIPCIGLFGKSAFQSLLEHFMGTVTLIYAMMDYKDEVEAVIEVMREKSNEVARIAADCDTEVFLSFEDTSTTNISPDYYEQYIMPEINDWCDILHDKGKLYVQHACGHLKHLLPLMAQSKIDGIESISPPPTGDIDIDEAIEFLPKHMAIIGGLEPVFMVNASAKELEERVHYLLKIMDGRPFVLANSDSCPPEVTEEQLIRVAAYVKSYYSTATV